MAVHRFGIRSSVWCWAKIFDLDQAAFRSGSQRSGWPYYCSFMYESFPTEMTFETGIDKINLRIRAVYVSGRSDLGLCISPTECLMPASSVNTSLQNGGNSNLSALFTLKLRTFHLWGKALLRFCSGSNKNKCTVTFWSIFGQLVYLSAVKGRGLLRKKTGLSQPILRKWHIPGVPNKRILRLISVSDNLLFCCEKHYST